MEFKGFCKERKRMCNSFEGCQGCPMHKEVKETFVSCHTFCVSYPEKAEEIVSKWSKENPIVTNLDKYKQLMKDHFGIMVTANETGVHLVGGSEISSSEWWNQEYKERNKSNA